MFPDLQRVRAAAMDWSWAQFRPYFDDLLRRPLSADSVDAWMADWSAVAALAAESFSRRSVAHTQDTNDTEAERRYSDFVAELRPQLAVAQQKLTERLLASGLEPADFTIPLRNLRTDAELFREANLPLETEESLLRSRYNKTVAAQTVEWAGEELTLKQLDGALTSARRSERKQAWLAKSTRVLADREEFNEMWGDLLANRRQQATNAGFTDYRAYRWHKMKRFDYTPADCDTFHAAIEAVVVPVATRIYTQAAKTLGVDRLRPWDVVNDIYLLTQPALRPFDDVNALENAAAEVFYRVDERLGDYYATMQQEHLLDLPNRKGKAPGGYCTRFPAARRPFIFMNAVGNGDDVRTLLHEAGHAFHVFEASNLPLIQQQRTTSEFSEVASMAMELLAAPYLTRDAGGFMSSADARRWRRRHLQKIILFWPYMAVVDAFQHWVYTDPDAAATPLACDAAWSALWQRFLPAVDWAGFEAVRDTGWQRKRHIFRVPFYYVEYGLAQLGAIQVWGNARRDEKEAIGRYLDALALGGTRAIPALYAAAGARFGFDAPLLARALALLESALAELAD